MRRGILVVGAGMAGVSVATARAAAGDTVHVVDKGRRHGGRMATRRVDAATFDTGVLDLAAYGPSFRAALEGWRDDGLAGEDDGRWRGTPSMRALPTALAEASGAEVRLATTVVGLAVAGDVWRVHVEHGGKVEVLEADALVMTAPAPQALALLEHGERLASPATSELLRTVTYAPSLTVLARPRDPDVRDLAAEDLAAADLADTDLIRCHRADLAGTSVVPALTLQAGVDFSAAHLDGDRSAAAATLAAQASMLVGSDLEVVHVHGWRYAQVTAGIAMPALRDDTSGAPLVLAGDLFEAWGDAPEDVRPEGVERAFHSGRAAAALL